MSLLSILYNPNAHSLEPYSYDEAETTEYDVATGKASVIIFRNRGTDIFRHDITYWVGGVNDGKLKKVTRTDLID